MIKIIKDIQPKIIALNIRAYGKHICKYYFIEEASELIKEMTKDMRGKCDKQHIKEELADVYYTASMIKQMYKFTDEDINDLITYKEARALKSLSTSKVLEANGDLIKHAIKPKSFIKRLKVVLNYLLT